MLLEELKKKCVTLFAQDAFDTYHWPQTFACNTKVFLNNTYRQQSTISCCLRIFICIQRFGFFRTMSDYLQLQYIPLLKHCASTLLFNFEDVTSFW